MLHVIAIPNYKEDVATLRRTIATLAQQRDASTQLVVVLAMEARDPLARATAQTLRKEFSHQFRGMHCTLHSLKSGEVAGKSSNENWAVRCAKRRYCDELSVFDQIELSSRLATPTRTSTRVISLLYPLLIAHHPQTATKDLLAGLPSSTRTATKCLRYVRYDTPYSVSA